MNKVFVVGMVGNSAFLSVDHFHEGGETLHAKSFFTEPGGKGFNQAIAASRFGAKVTFASAIGNDGYGAQVEAFLQKEGIASLLMEKQGPSAFAAILTDRNGVNHVTVYPGASLSANDVSIFQKGIEDADVLLLGNEVPEDVNILCAEIAHQAKTRIVFNPAPYRKMPNTLIDLIDLFTPNEFETVGLENQMNCIVTLGERGCLDRTTGKIYPAEKVQPIDTTGAGDTFNGVLTAMLACGKAFDEAITLANKAASLSVMKKGVVCSIPYLQDVIAPSDSQFI